MFLVIVVAGVSAAAQDAGSAVGLEPLEVIATQAEGLVGGAPAADAGTARRSLRDYLGQPVVLYRLERPDLPDPEHSAYVVPRALADSGLPVVLLLGGKDRSRKRAEKVAEKLSSNVSVAWGKKLVVEGGAYLGVWLYGSDGQPRAAMSVYSNADAWMLKTAAEKLLAEAGMTPPPPHPRRRRLMLEQPFPPELVDGLLGGAPDGGNAGPASLGGYLGQPHVIFLACPGCGGPTDLENFLKVAAPYSVPVIALVSHTGSTREAALELQKQLRPRPGLRFGWGDGLKPDALGYSASTALFVDKHGLIRFQRPCSIGELPRSEWLVRAALERLQQER